MQGKYPLHCAFALSFTLSTSLHMHGPWRTFFLLLYRVRLPVSLCFLLPDLFILLHFWNFKTARDAAAQHWNVPRKSLSPQFLICISTRSRFLGCWLFSYFSGLDEEIIDFHHCLRFECGSVEAGGLIYTDCGKIPTTGSAFIFLKLCRYNRRDRKMNPFLRRTRGVSYEHFPWHLRKH